MSNEEKAESSSESKYRVVAGAQGIFYEGYSEIDAHVQFRIFVARSKATLGGGDSVLLFKNAEIIREYHPP